jgi:hypothetical protein
MTVDTHHSPKRLLAEAQSALRIQQNIVQSLDLLLKLSAAQLDTLDEHGWEQVLQRKQLLLDEIEQMQLAIHINLARRLAEQLHSHNQWEAAESLHELNRVIREKLILLAEREHLAQQHLEQQVTQLRGTLCAKQHQWQGQGAYKGPVTAAPARFLDGLR